jgi:hypothetical protein
MLERRGAAPNCVAAKARTGIGNKASSASVFDRNAAAVSGACAGMVATSKAIERDGAITEWRNQEDRPSMQVLRQYRYLSARFTLSKSGDWSGRAYVEVSDSNVDDIKRYVPARLRIRQNWNG